MRNVIVIVLFLLIACNNAGEGIKESKDSASAGGSKLLDRKERPIEMLGDSVRIQRYAVTDTIMIDLDGDERKEKVYFSAVGKERFVVIESGEPGGHLKLGLDIPVERLEWTDFSWVDFWGPTKDSITWEAVMEGDEIMGTRKVRLARPSIVFRSAEAGGGVLTHLNGKYMWIHQSD